MKLHILRHGNSPSASEAGVPRDFERPLSTSGREDVRKMALHLAGKGGRPVIILHSPLKRAVETAGQAAAVLKPAQGVEAFPPLANEISAEDLAAKLKQRCLGLTEAVAVGHQPQLGELVALLSNAVFNLRPGGMVSLDLKDDGPASVLWAANPEDLQG